MALMDHLGSLAAMEILALKVFLGHLDPRVTLEMKVLLVHLAVLGQRERRERRAPVASRGSVDPKELKVHV